MIARFSILLVVLSSYLGRAAAEDHLKNSLDDL